MGDRGRRQHERAAATDVDAAARLLVERVRAGELPQRRLQLAALLGDAVARRAVGQEAAAPVQALDAWLHDLAEWGHEAVARAAIAAARVAIAGLGPVDGELDERARTALEQADAWLAGGCQNTPPPGSEGPARSGSPAGVSLLGVLTSLDEALWPSTAQRRARSRARPLRVNLAKAAAVRVVAAAMEATSEERVREAIRAELVPWALGR